MLFSLTLFPPLRARRRRTISLRSSSPSSTLFPEFPNPRLALTFLCHFLRTFSNSHPGRILSPAPFLRLSFTSPKGASLALFFSQLGLPLTGEDRSHQVIGVLSFLRPSSTPPFSSGRCLKCIFASLPPFSAIPDPNLSCRLGFRRVFRLPFPLSSSGCYRVIWLICYTFFRLYNRVPRPHSSLPSRTKSIFLFRPTPLFFVFCFLYGHPLHSSLSSFFHCLCYPIDSKTKLRFPPFPLLFKPQKNATLSACLSFFLVRIFFAVFTSSLGP